MLSQTRPALVTLGLMTAVCGFAYPLAMTGVSQAVFPSQAKGSLIERDGQVLGSELVGQFFTSPRYFHGRPSAAGEGYDAAASSGTNYGATNAALIASVRSEAERQSTLNAVERVPVDLVTSSSSGLDPHITPEAARVQIARVAEARGVAPEDVATLVAEFTERPDLGLLGEPRVNVLLLNLALDAAAPAPVDAAVSR